MIITIQGIPERAKEIKRLRTALADFPYPVHLHLDTNRTGPFNSFRDMLNKYTGEEYRLSLQDDSLLSEDLKDELPKILDKMKNEGIDFVTLFIPNRREFREAWERGEEFVKFKDFLWMPAIIMSPKVQKILREEANKIEGYLKDDDVFVGKILKQYKIDAYGVMPSLVQHDISVRSSLGHRGDTSRISPFFIK